MAYESQLDQIVQQQNNLELNKRHQCWRNHQRCEQHKPSHPFGRGAKAFCSGLALLVPIVPP